VTDDDDVDKLKSIKDLHKKSMHKVGTSHFLIVHSISNTKYKKNHLQGKQAQYLRTHKREVRSVSKQ
jgi:hypothetical protein